MAKGVNFIGKVRGKMGGVVFRVSDGKQIASEYNPAPFNPKSVRQSAQRFKFAFVQAIASQIPSVELDGLGGRPLARRSELLKAMLNNTIVEGYQDALSATTARLDAGRIPFARGPLARPAVTVAAALAEEGTILNVTLTTEIGGVGNQVRCAVFVTPNIAIEGEVKPLVVFGDALPEGNVVPVDIAEMWKDQGLTVQVVSWLKADDSSEIAQNYLKKTRGVANELIGALSTREVGAYMYSTSQLSAYLLVEVE